MTDSSIIIRMQDSAGSFKGQITQGGWWQGATGAAANPALSCRTDTNTGFAFLTADTISAVTGGSER